MKKIYHEGIFATQKHQYSMLTMIKPSDNNFDHDMLWLSFQIVYMSVTFRSSKTIHCCQVSTFCVGFIRGEWVQLIYVHDTWLTWSWPVLLYWGTQLSYTETEMLPFWWNFNWLYRKLSLWQLSVSPLMKVSSMGTQKVAITTTFKIICPFHCIWICVRVCIFSVMRIWNQ